MTESQRFAPYALALLRIVTGLVFLQHGLEKLFHFPDAGHMTGPYQFLSLPGIGAFLELFGGLAMVTGLAVRYVAFVLCGEMAVAYFVYHFPAVYANPRGFFPVVNGGDLAVLFCFVYFYFSFAGAGQWSIDHTLGSRKSGPKES